jgi:DNA-binding FrmR family transcriptional regulator
MNDCTKIELMLYLYRAGELSEQERVMVNKHVEQCSSCKVILQQLHSMEGTLEPLRSEVLSSVAAHDIKRKTLNTISAPQRIPANVTSFGALRPLFGAVVIAIVGIFFAQQVRDANVLAALEQRMNREGRTSVQTNLFEYPAEPAGMHAVQRAALSGNLLNALAATYPKFHRENGELFNEFAAKYPELFNLIVKDGIDEKERKILLTEGKLFIKEFEQLLHEKEQHGEHDNETIR